MGEGRGRESRLRRHGGRTGRMGPGLLRAVLDANVLYPQFLRDVLLRLAASDLYRPHRSDRIHDEWIRNVISNRPYLSPANFSRTRRQMDAYFPGALIVGHEVLEKRVPAVHPKDRHVAAVALHVAAQRIVTRNLKDFPADILQPHGIVPLHPDDFICELIRGDAALVRRVLERHRVGLQRPPHAQMEYATVFRASGLIRAAGLLWP